MGKIRLIFRLSLYLLLTFLLLPMIILLKFLGLEKAKATVIALYYRLSAYSWGIRLRLEGAFDKNRPLLVVSNHCSYADIPVLGSFAPVHFTPKSEIRDWPVIGYLCRLSDCIFINRNPRKTAENMAALEQAMQAGWMISLFPEGTTNDGSGPLPFRSSYFSLAEKGLPVQPVTILYTAKNGEPLSPQALRKVAWIGEDEFTSHLFDFLKQPGILATVICHEPVTIEDFGNRKELAAACERQVASGFDKKEGALQEDAP